MEAPSLTTDIELGVWRITADRVGQYLDAVGDASVEYQEYHLVPPLALAAYVLGAMLNQLDLPSGVIHSLQEIETLQAVKFGQEIKATAQVERPRRRGNLEFITVRYCLDNLAGESVQRGTTTVLVTGAGES